MSSPRPLLPPLVWVLLAAAAAMPLRAQEGSRPAAAQEQIEKTEGEESREAESIRFRRIHVPADRIAQWPDGRTKYMPLEAAEFERLLAATHTNPPGTTASAGARLLASQYEARLEGDRLVAGQATLEVAHATDAAVLVSLDPCGLAIGAARWTETEPIEGEATAATWGLSDDGKLGLLIHGSGRLDLEWSLSGRRETSGAVEFDMELPASPVNRLSLDIPDAMVPTADRGIVHAAERGTQGWRRWHIELGGHHRFRLRIAPAATADQTGQSVVVRQATVYDFSLRGIDVSSRLNIETDGEPVRQVALTLDGGLQLIDAQYGEASVPWSVASDNGPAGSNGSTGSQVVLWLPEPIEGAGRVLRLSASAPLQTDHQLQLPRIRPEGMFWQEGSLTLRTPSSLLIEQLTPVGCRQWDARSTPGEGQSAEFRCFGPDATVEIVMARRKRPIRLSSGTSVRLGGGEITTETRVDFHSLLAHRYGRIDSRGSHSRLDRRGPKPSQSQIEHSAGPGTCTDQAATARNHGATASISVGTGVEH